MARSASVTVPLSVKSPLLHARQIAATMAYLNAMVLRGTATQDGAQMLRLPSLLSNLADSSSGVGLIFRRA